jgi:hypothetical protein
MQNSHKMFFIHNTLLKALTGMAKNYDDHGHYGRSFGLKLENSIPSTFKTNY